MGANYSFKQFIAGSCYSYILGSAGQAVVIDPHISLRGEYSFYLKRRGFGS